MRFRGVVRRMVRASAAGVAVAAALGVTGPVASAQQPDRPVLVVAHRGASAEAPEHTFAAYDRAVEQGADVLECDLQLSEDGVPVCLHDATVDRTTGGASTGRVDSFTLDELRAMDFGSWKGPEWSGQRIVPFEEQLRCYAAAAPDLRFYVETKAPAEYGGKMEPALVDLLRRLGLVPEGSTADVDGSAVIVQSFDLTSLQAVKALAPSLPTAWLMPVVPPEVAAGLVPEGVDIVAPSADALAASPGTLAAVHAAGRPVHTYTVDEPAEMRALVDAGIDGFFTNVPATARGVVDQAGRAVDGTGGARPAPAAGCPGVAGTVRAGQPDLTPIGAPGTTSAGATGGGTGSGPAEQAAAPEPASSGVATGVVVLAGVLAAAVVAGVVVLVVRRRGDTT